MSETNRTGADAVSASTFRTQLANARRIVVKIGSSLLTDPEHGIAREGIEQWAAQIAELLSGDRQIVLVSSGAVAEGAHRLGFKVRPEAVHELQAAAAVGQMGLMEAYEQAFRRYDRTTAIVLLTHDDLANRQRYLNAKATLKSLLEFGVVPVINENDTVSTDEIRFGDNDTLAALVANLIQADTLLLLTDRDGLHESDPRINPAAPIVDFAFADDERLVSMAGIGAGGFGRGGMVSKLQAARLAARSGAHTVIADGRRQEVIAHVLTGVDQGTLLASRLEPLLARKQWIADQLKAKGNLIIDVGAVRALREKGVSLLPVGIKSVSGSFVRGELVRCVDESGTVIGQGLVNYSSLEVAKLAGAASSDISARLGYVDEDEVVHRDNLVTF